MSMRKDTCLKKKCPFWTRYGEACPNFVTGSWRTNEGHEYDTADCAPKRSMILCQQIYDQLICTRKDYSDVRRSMVDVLQIAACNGGVEFIEGTVEEAKQIEDNTDHGKDTVQ